MNRDPRTIVPGSRGEHEPLSFAQQRLWLLDQLEPAPWAYNVSIVRRLKGHLRVDALRRALGEVVARHEVLRTTYPTVDGHPVQAVGVPGPFDLTIVDLTGRARAEADAEAVRRAGVEARRWFDLANGPLIRALLVKVSRDDSVLALTMHHITTDAWSEGVLLGELSALYNAFARDAPSPLAPPTVQYADFASWQRSSSMGTASQAQLDYWLQRLETLPPLLEIPSDRPRPIQRSGRGETIPVEISAALTSGLRQVTRAGRATLYMTLLAALQVLLGRYSGEDDIAVGSPIANRTRPETAAVLGFFANTMVLRTDLCGDPNFMEVLAQVREVALGAYSHQDVPFERLVKELRPERSLSHTSLFQHMFVFQNTPDRDLELDGLAVEEVAMETDTAMFDLTLLLSERDDVVVGWLEYATDLYDRSSAERLARHFTNLLEAIVADPRAPIRALELLDDDERRQLVVEWNETSAPFPAGCIHTCFEDQAEHHPNDVALTAGDVSLTYEDLNERANRLARHLQSLGVGPEVRVGICLPRSSDAVVALLATLKAGGAYLPLDPEYPTARLAFMIDDGSVEVVITRNAHRDRLPASVAQVVCLDLDEEQIAAMPPSNPASAVTADDLAYVLYTSGSTGTPKGVMVEHRAVVALLFGVDYIRFDEVGALLHMAPLSFDAATFEIWGALLHGGRCVVYDDLYFSLERFGDLMRSENVDTLWLTASLFNLVLDENWRHLSGVRQLIVGGEALSPTHVADALRLLPGLRLVNGYGPTEATTFAVCHEIDATDADGRSVPIGRPIANTEIYILDANLRPVPVNVVGELYIAGVGLARGYLERPELTAECFVSHRFDADTNARLYRTGDLVRYLADGNVEFVGRVDDQLKIRGFRVEPGEVEAALREHPAVAAAVVVASEREMGHRQLVAYAVASTTARPPKGDLQDFLRTRLPAYLVPADVVWLDALPLSQNGKLDRAALRDAEEPREKATYVAPTSSMERVQAAIWTDVLGIERVGIDDNFFDLGGDSLLAALLFARTARQTGRDIPLSILFRNPTIREVAKAIEQDDAREETSMVPLHPAGSRPPLILGHGVSGLLFRYTPLLRRLDPEQPVYGLCPTESMVGGRGRLRIEDLAQHYVQDILRRQPAGPYCLGGFCFGGVLVIEVAHQLESLGRTVATVVLFDAEPSSSPPVSKPRREVAQLAALLRHEESARTYLQRRYTNAKIKVRRWPWLADHWLHVRTGRPLSERWDDVERVQALHAFPLQRTLNRALGSYMAPTTKCTITTISAGDPTASTTGIRFLPGADDTYIVDGPGVSHETLMDEPFVSTVATVLTDLLGRACDDAGRGPTPS
jgi:amino acid adenylation domain-containing protein